MSDSINYIFTHLLMGMGVKLKGSREYNIMDVKLTVILLVSDLLLRNTPVGIFLQLVSVIKEK